MIFDTHAHYDDEAFQEDRDELLNSLSTCLLYTSDAADEL